MKLSLLFLESLKKQIKKLLRTYPSLDETTIKLLNSADPTGNEAKYTKWLTQQYIKGNIDLDNGFTQRQEIYDKLAIFDKNPWKFPSNDIYKLNIKDLLETEAVDNSKINYSKLLQSPNRLLKKTGNYKLIEINAYKGMEQFKKESDTVPTKWCVAYPDMFKHYGPPMYLIINDEEPYIMIVYHDDELKYIDDDPITFKTFKKLLDIGFIDIGKLTFIKDSKEFVDYFLQKYDFNELLKLDNIRLLVYYLYIDSSVEDKVASIVWRKNDYEAAKIYGDVTNDNYELLRKLILKNMDNLKWAYWYVENIIKNRWGPAEEIIINSNNPKYAYYYAKYIIQDRWVPAEQIIIGVQDPEYAYLYAANIINGRWEPAEKIIIDIQDPEYAYLYAANIILGRWEPAEEMIIDIQDPEYAYLYAMDVIQNRWEPAEQIIIDTKNPKYAYYYTADIIHNRWEPAEKIIINSKNPEWAYLYASRVIKNKWPPAEQIIIKTKNPIYAYLYTFHVIRHRWESAERIIINSDDIEYAVKYAINVIKNRWPEAEPMIAQSNYWWFKYQEFLRKLQK